MLTPTYPSIFDRDANPGIWFNKPQPAHVYRMNAADAANSARQWGEYIERLLSNWRRGCAQTYGEDFGTYLARIGRLAGTDALNAVSMWEHAAAIDAPTDRR